MTEALQSDTYKYQTPDNHWLKCWLFAYLHKPNAKAVWNFISAFVQNKTSPFKDTHTINSIKVQQYCYVAKQLNCWYFMSEEKPTWRWCQNVSYTISMLNLRIHTFIVIFAMQIFLHVLYIIMWCQIFWLWSWQKDFRWSIFGSGMLYVNCHPWMTILALSTNFKTC